MIFYRQYKEVMKRINENEKIIVKNISAAFIIKGLALIISFVSTPLFLRFFNEDKVVLGVWYTLLSILTWITTFDLGIGNGIRNKLVNAFAKKDEIEAKRIISSGMFANLVVTVILALIGYVLLVMLDLNKVLNISPDNISKRILKSSAYITFATIMLRFYLSIVGSVFYAIQKSSVNNLISLFSNIAQLIFLLLFNFSSSEEALLYLSIGYLITTNLPIIIAGIIVFTTKLKSYIPSVKFVDKQHIKGVMGVGGVFFFCQITYMLIMNTNELLISNLFSPEYTTDYTFYFKLTGLISTILTLALTPVWSVVTKARAEKNYIWLRKLYKILTIIGLGAVTLEFLIIPFLQPIMNIWLGENSITVNYKIAVAFACFGSVFIYIAILSAMVCGMTRMKLQTISYSIVMVFRFVLIFILAKLGCDWSVVVWSTALLLLPYCIIQHIDLVLYFNKKIKEQKVVCETTKQ